mgnify:CR=1 FL=1
MANSGNGKNALRRMSGILLRMFTYALLGITIFTGGLFSMAYLLQERVLFPATSELDRDPAFYDWPFEDVVLPVGEYWTHGWFVPLENARGVVLFSHGNAGNLADRLESIGFLRAMGFAVMAYDYGGYGKSTGRPSEARLYADIRAVWNYLTAERGYDPDEIVLFGRSLGGGPTTDLAAEVRPAGVVLESTFTSAPAVANDIFRLIPLGWVLRHQFDNRTKVPLIQAPLMVVHSPDDTLIRYKHGRALYERATEPKRFLELRGDHNEGFVLSGAVYKQGWESFLEDVLPRPPGENVPEPVLT